MRGSLPESFWKEDESGWVVATDLGFMSTSTKRKTPVDYMEAGETNLLWKIECQAQKAHGFGCGADIKILSQFASEDEMLFPPCTMLKVKPTDLPALSLPPGLRPQKSVVEPSLTFEDVNGKTVGFYEVETTVCFE